MGNLLWQDERVDQLMTKSKAAYCLVSSAAMGLCVKQRISDEVADKFLKKRWQIATTHPRLPEALTPFAEAPSDIDEDQFIQCRGYAAKQSAHYPQLFAKKVWQAITPRLSTMVLLPGIPCAISERAPAGDNSMCSQGSK